MKVDHFLRLNNAAGIPRLEETASETGITTLLDRLRTGLRVVAARFAGPLPDDHP